MHGLNMTVEKDGRRSPSPVHIHVDEQTPVHVHLKTKSTATSHSKKHSKANKSSVENKLSDAKNPKSGASNLRRSKAPPIAKARSTSPPRGPWVPPPARTTGGAAPPNNNKYAWLVDVPRSLREPDHSQKNTLLEASRRILDEHEREIEEYRLELESQEIHNDTLRQSMNFFKDDADYTRDHLSAERDLLMKKLVEVELDGQAAAKQMASLRDSIRTLREESRMSQQDSSMLGKQKELLMDRLADFEATNRTLRGMLRDRHEEEGANVRLVEQRDLLLKRLTETEDRVQQLRTEMLEKERRCVDIEMSLSAQKQENITMSGMQATLEGTRGHLQKQLRQKEADCNRMAVQIRSLESQLAQERIDVEHLNELLQQAKGKADKDKEALKKATRVQKQRATKSEDAVEQMNVQLLEREQILADERSEHALLQARSDKVNMERAQFETENAAMRTRIREVECQLANITGKYKTEEERLNLQLQDRTSECTRLKIDAEHVRSSMAGMEDKVMEAEQDSSQVSSKLRQYETLVEEYRDQLNRSRREADETMQELEDQKRETSRIQGEGKIEMEKVKSRLQNRLQELEPLPDLLKTTELQLQDSHEKLMSYERKSAENAHLIDDLTAKLEKQGTELDMSFNKEKKDRSERQHMAARVETMERRLRDLESQNRDLLATVTKREEAVHQANIKLDEKSRESLSLSQQLEDALTETRRQSQTVLEQSASKDRTAHARLLDLEAQLSQTQTEITRVKREKEEMERKFNSRLYDLKDRLDQSHSTNRSMQNYVQFLKNSYANVFGDSASPLRGPSSFR